MKTSRLISVLVVYALLGAVLPISAAPVPATHSAGSTMAEWSRPGPGVVANEIEGATDPAVYIILQQAQALSTYRGGIAGLAPTNPEARGELRLDPNSPASAAYLSYLDQQQTQLITSMESAVGHPVEVVFQYQVAVNGLAARLTPQEAAVVATLPGVAHVERETFLEPLTDAGPAWIGAPGIWDGTATGGLPGTQGEGIVAGIIDTGINHDHPSFADPGPVDGFDHTNPRLVHFGVCAPLNPVLCNDKLIGMYDFTGTGPFDDVLHGSHVASTVAGNVVDAELIAPTITVEARISGVAPHANIISYKVCSSVEFPELGSCPISALIAGINRATLDVVDVINFSIGGDPFDPWSDPLALAFFGARSAGIFVATSAGNSGPGAATVGRPANAPWITSVGASTHDRKPVNTLIDMSGGASAPPADIDGKSVTSGYGPASIVDAGAAPHNNPLCNPFPAGTFNGEIVVCERGVIGRVEKGQNVKNAGGGGMVLVNDAPSGDSLIADVHVLPAVHISFANGQVLKSWLASGSGHTATIAGTTNDVNPAHGDVMASFSSRGPNAPALDILKPDVTAPGVDIFAAFHTPDPVNPGPPEYGIISGTSMSSPHTAGAAALLRALHPDWTPDQVRSALMTTAFTTPPGNGAEVHEVLKEDEATPADPFDMGAGRIDLSKAGRAGVVLDESPANYNAADPGTGGDPKALNLPSMADSDCRGTCSWVRVVESTASTSVTWSASAQAPPLMGLSVTPSSFTLAPGASQTIKVTADVSALQTNQWYFGQVALTPSAPSIPAAHLPVAAFAGIERVALHFHGNIHDGCTGNGAADIDACDGPFLREDANLDTGPAARWGPVPVVLNCTDASGGRCLSDPNWVWYLDDTTALEGPMTVQWWYSCPGCNLLLANDFNIRLWADGVKVFEERVRNGILVPDVPRLLRTTVELPRLTANETFVLHIDPIFINQDQSVILYDSTLPCPGAATLNPCDSLVLMPVVDAGTPVPPPPQAPVQNPIADDDPPDQVNGIDRDGNYRLSWSYPAPPAQQPCGFRIEEATFFDTAFFDDAEEPLVLGSNTKWTGDPEWTSALHPNTLTPGYAVAYTDEINVSLTMVDLVALPAGVNASLSFDSFENIEATFDFGYVEVSADGGPFNTIAAFTGIFSGKRELDLSQFGGQSIRVRFRFETDELVSFAVGWVIDNIQIEVNDFTPIATVDGSTFAFDVTGRTDGTYFYRMLGLFGNCAEAPQVGPASNVESITVELATEPTGGDKTTGGGWLQTNVGKKINFGFTAEETADGLIGDLQLNDKAAGVKIDITTVTFLGGVQETCGSVLAGPNSLELQGTGTYNGSAATFRVCVQDNGEPGHSRASDSPDLFYLECLADCDYDTSSRTPDDAIDGGNIDVQRAAASSDPSEPSTSAMILDPVLLTEGVVGQLQLFTVTVYDQNQEVLANAEVVLTRTASDGSFTTLTAITDLTGTAIFSTLNLAQVAEFIATSGSAESNAVEVSPILNLLN